MTTGLPDATCAVSAPSGAGAVPPSPRVGLSAVGALVSFRLYETGIRLVLGLSAVAAGLVLLLSRGYQGLVFGALGGACLAGGVYGLIRAVQSWRGHTLRGRAALVAVGSGLVLAVCSCAFLSRWVQEANEALAWQRHQQDGSAPEARWRAYQQAVPEAFQRRQAEADYLLALVQDPRTPKDTLRWHLEDLQARYGDDPTLEPVRQAIHEALQRKTD